MDLNCQEKWVNMEDFIIQPEPDEKKLIVREQREGGREIERERERESERERAREKETDREWERKRQRAREKETKSATQWERKERGWGLLGEPPFLVQSVNELMGKISKINSTYLFRYVDRTSVASRYRMQVQCTGRCAWSSGAWRRSVNLLKPDPDKKNAQMKYWFFWQCGKWF